MKTFRCKVCGEELETVEVYYDYFSPASDGHEEQATIEFWCNNCKEYYDYEG